jgi:hypothetical protein
MRNDAPPAEMAAINFVKKGSSLAKYHQWDSASENASASFQASSDFQSFAK